MTVVGIDNDLLFGCDFVIHCKLRGGRADVVHQTCEHQNLGADSRCEELHVDITELFEELLLALVGGVKISEIVAQALRCVLFAKVF